MIEKIKRWFDRKIYGNSPLRVEIMPRWLQDWCCPNCKSDAFVEHNNVFYCGQCEYKILVRKDANY